MMVSDEVVAVFPAKFKEGDIQVVYCPHNRIYELRYAVSLRSRADGKCRLVRSTVAFDACDYAQVARMLIDARVLADTLLLERC